MTETQGYGEFSLAEPSGPPVYIRGSSRLIDAVVKNGKPETFPAVWFSPHIGEQYFFGYLKYVDIFKKNHTSRFCCKVYPASPKFDTAGPPDWNGWD